MNKKILAAAIAATIVAPVAVAADVTVYGVVHNSVDFNDDSVANSDTTNVLSRGSRLGFKGSEDLGNGMKANFQMEFAVDAADQGFTNSRNTYVGLSGDFGEIRVGHHDTPAKLAAISLSKFGDQLGDVNQTAFFVNTHSSDAIAYLSPNMSGFSFAAAIVPGGSEVLGPQPGTANNNADDLAAGYSLGAFYDNAGLSVRAWYENLDSIVDNATVATSDPVGAWLSLTTTATLRGSDVWGIGAKYTMDALYVAAGYQEHDIDTTIAAANVSVEIDSWMVEGGYTFGNNTIKAQYANVDVDVTGSPSSDDDTWTIGLDHKLSKRTMVYAQYASSDTGANSNGLSSINNGSNASLGLGNLGLGYGSTTDDSFSVGISHKF